MLVIAACTRERPLPNPTATTAIQVNNVPATASVDAQIVTDTPPSASGGAAPASSSEAGLAVTDTPAVSTTASSAAPGQPATFQYVVQSGDTLGSIADQFETDVDTLRSLNNLNSDSLAVGQPLYVPYKEGMTVAGMPTPTPGPYMYTIQPGDTISGLSARFNVDPAAIINANTTTMGDPNNLAVGTSIVIPGYQPPGAANTETANEEGGTPTASSEGGQVVHVVQSGQGLLEIATLYGVPVADIMAANGLTDQDILRIGQKLIIPGVTKRDVAAAQGDVHIVQAGESLLSIALLYGVTVDELQTANDLDNPDSIYVGQELIIPKQQ